MSKSQVRRLAIQGCPKPSWAVDQVQRASGLVEDICEHGVGHPNIHWLRKHPELAKKECLGIHGCDGCCSQEDDDAA